MSEAAEIRDHFDQLADGNHFATVPLSFREDESSIDLVLGELAGFGLLWRGFELQ